MQEIKKRLDASLDSLEEAAANPEHSDNWKNAEFCYLQIRKSCEYTALAILASHQLYGDNSVKQLAKKWHPGEIFTGLLQLNSYAFPVPVTVQLNLNGPGMHHITPSELIFQPQALKSIYGQCGDRLHAGSLKQIMDRKLSALNFGEIAGWQNQLLGTLNNHMVSLPHIGSTLLVMLKGGIDGQVGCVWGDAVGPFVIDGDPTVFNDNQTQ